MIAEAIAPLQAEIKALKEDINRLQGKGRAMLTIFEAAKELKVSDATLRNYVKWGVIKKSERAGGASNSQHLFDPEEISFLKENRHLLRRPQ